MRGKVEETEKGSIIEIYFIREVYIGSRLQVPFYIVPLLNASIIFVMFVYGLHLFISNIIPSSIPLFLLFLGWIGIQFILITVYPRYSTEWEEKQLILFIDKIFSDVKINN